MKKGIARVFCLLISLLMVLTSLPIGVLAEAVTDPSMPVANAETAQTTSLQMSNSDLAENLTTVSIDEPQQTVEPLMTEAQDDGQTMATSEIMETMATETDGFYTFVVENNTAAITGYSGTDSIITIPETLTTSSGKVVAVTAIKNGAFMSATALTKVTISPNINSMTGEIFNKTVTICGTEGSLADSYATEWGLTFEKTAVFYVKDFTSDQDSGVKIKSTINLTATLSDWNKTISSYQFSYDLTDCSGITETGTIISGTANKVSYLPSKAGTYTFYVKVTDVDGNTCVKTIDNFIVLPEIKLSAKETAPQYVNTPLTLTAEVDDGLSTTGYDYEFSYQLGSDSKVIQTSSATKSVTFTPITAGVYTFKVAVKNQIGTTEFSSTKSIEYNVIDYVYIKTFTVDKLSPQEAGTAITLKAEAAGGKTTGYKYRFFYKLNGGTEEDIQDYADTASVVFRPTEPGTYQLGVQVMNAMGVPSAAKTSAMNIISTPGGTFTVAKTDGTPFYLKDTDPIVLKVTNPTGYSGTLYYKYYYTLGTGTDKTQIGLETTSNSTNFTPTEKGTYKFYVEIIDKAAVNSVTTTKTVTGYEVYDQFAGTGKLTTSLVSPQNKGATVKLTASASGGKAPYSYAFSYIPPGGGNTVLESSSNTADLVMNDAGDYSITVVITDANGIKETETITYKINDNPQIVKFDPQPGYAYYINEDINFTTEIDGGTSPYTYEFTGKLGTQTVWKRDASATATATFTPTVAGTYSFEVKVTDSKGLSETKTVKDYKVLPAVAVKTLKADKSSGQNVGTEIKLTATGSGGKSPYTYKFYAVLAGVTTDLTGGTYVESNTTTFTPLAAGIYTLYTDIKDANGKELIKAGTIANYKVVNAPVLASYSADKDMTKGETGTASIYPGDTINLKAKTTSSTGEGTTLTYQFFYKQGSAEVPIGSAIAKTDPLKYEEATASFKPDKAGAYTIYVRVTDGNGSKDEEKIASLKVFGAVESKAVKVSKTTGVIVGDTVKLSATATGGKSPYTYKYYYKKGAGAITLIPSDPTAKTVDYTFKTADGSGDYTFYVEIIDDNNVDNRSILDEAFLKTASSTVTVTNPPQVTGSYEITAGGSALYAGKTTIALTAETLNGTGDGDLIYQFFYKQGSTEMPINGAITKSDPTKYDAVTTDFKPDVAGSYTVYVRVTTDGGKLKDEAKIGTFKILPVVTANAVTVSKTTGVLVGDTVKITAGGSGGQTPYQYQYYYKKNETGPLTPIGSTTEEKTKQVNFSSSEYGSGTYRFYVKITDVNSEVSASTDAGILLSASPMVTVTNPPSFASISYSKTGVDAAIADLYAGDTVELKAKAQEGSGEDTLTYQFFYKQGTTEVKIGDPQEKTGSTKYEEATVDFPLTKSGSYTVYVRLTDGTSTSIAKIGTLKVLDLISVKAVKVSKTSGLIVGDQIKLTASGTGGKIPYQSYQFYQRDIASTDPAYYPIGTASTEKTMTYTLPSAGTYVYTVKITDANGETSDNLVKTDQVTIGNPPVMESFTVSPEKGSAVYVGDQVSLQAKVKADSGIGDCEWRFTYKVGTMTKTADAVVVGDVATATIDLVDPGTYAFTASVTDENGAQAVKTISSYPVLSKVEVKGLTANLESGQNINTSIKLTATGVGGKAPYAYKFYWIYQDSTEPVYINSTYSSSNTAVFIPKKAGFYSLHVSIRDANGDISSNDLDNCIMDYEVIDNPIIKSFTTVQSSGQYVETPIDLTAVVAGGNTPYTYKFTYKLGSEPEKEVENSDGDQTATFTPTKAGTYSFYVYVTDFDGNPKPAAKKEIKSFVIYNQPTVKSFTASSTKITKGKSVTLKATVDGGQSPYQYRFYYKTGDTPTEIRKFSTTSSYSWTPKTAGTYTVYVDIMDAKGTPKTTEQPLTIQVD